MMQKAERIEQETQRRGNQAIQKLGDMGKSFAKSIVYYDTGFTYKSIKKKTSKAASGDYVRIYIDPEERPIDGIHRRSAGQYPNFSLVRWSHTSPQAGDRRWSGDRMFMFTTREYLEDRKARVAEGSFNNIKV